MKNKEEANTCICTIDKDLNGTPGLHYNWRKDELYWVTELEARLFFYKQLLTGDSTDNIQGIYGIGDKKAQNIIDIASMEADEEGWNDEVLLEEIYWTVLDQYAIAHDKPMEALIENARLLYIRRESNEMWRPQW